MRLLVEVMRAQSRVCLAALPKQIQSAVKMRADESVRQRRTSHGEPSGPFHPACATLVADPGGFAGRTKTACEPSSRGRRL